MIKSFLKYNHSIISAGFVIFLLNSLVFGASVPTDPLSQLIPCFDESKCESENKQLAQDAQFGGMTTGRRARLLGGGLTLTVQSQQPHQRQRDGQVVLVDLAPPPRQLARRPRPPPPDQRPNTGQRPTPGQRPSPTRRPTPIPTPRPTLRPTPRPTARPTPRPTPRPSARPSTRPSRGSFGGMSSGSRARSHSQRGSMSRSRARSGSRRR